MLESFNTKSEMQYQRLTEEEKQKRGILGRLVGIIADFKNSTRNGRRYTEELWDKTFNDPIVKEKLENRCLFGELGHPVDRQEIDMEKIAICLAEMPKKGNDGKLYGVFDILDTPNGRILKTMCDYGCNIGVSSRGGGDTFEDYDGGETVEPDSYELECWDAVLLPAVKCARPAYVTESYKSKKTLKTALQEALERSTEDEQRVMKTTLEELQIDYSSSGDEDNTLVETYYGATYRDKDNVKHKIIFNCDGDIDDAENMLDDVIPEPYIKATLLGSMPFDQAKQDGFELVEKIVNLPEKVEDIDVTSEDMAAEDNGADVITELQEALQRQLELETQVKTLQEKLSVCYTKESRYSDRLGKANSKVATQETENKQLSEQMQSLTDKNNQLNRTIAELTETLDLKTQEIQKLTESLSGYRNRFKTIQTKLTESKSNKTLLDESLSSKTAEVEKLTEAYSQLKESSELKLQEATKQHKQLETVNKKLVEELEDVKKDSQIIKSQNNAKLEKAQQLVEKYKSVAKTAVDKYISSQATKIGVSSSDVKARLNESYSFKDIDNAIEQLQQYKLNLNSLPFNTIAEKKPVKLQIRESKEHLLDLKDKTSYNIDDDIDETLLSFTN